jgi:sugar O-acyltransferase (sialic acid O-acetyltransferase NeuD family)
MVKRDDSRWLIYGCRTSFTSEVTEILWRLGADVAAYVDNVPDGPSAPLEGRVVTPRELTAADRRLPCVIPLITPGHRHTLEAEARGHGLASFPKLVDPTSVVARTTALAEGTVVNALAVIGAKCRFGKFVHVNRGASIGHDAEIGDFVTFGPSCIVAGSVTIERGAFIGAGAILTPKIRVGANAIINAGAVVTGDVPAGAVMAGNPARIKRTCETGYGHVRVPERADRPGFV